MLLGIAMWLVLTPPPRFVPIAVFGLGLLFYSMAARTLGMWLSLYGGSLVLAAFLWPLPLPESMPPLMRLGIIIGCWSIIFLGGCIILVRLAYRQSGLPAKEVPRE